MSSAAVYETERPAEDIARDLNSDFQFIADRLPSEVKEGYAGEVFTLASVEGVGVLWAKYAGQQANGRLIARFVVQIGMLAEGYDTRLDFAKDYKLAYGTNHQEGHIQDMYPVRGEDLEGCPVPLSYLAFAATSLRDEFTRTHTENLEHSDDIIQLDKERVA